jgi:hypothetical protein
VASSSVGSISSLDFFAHLSLPARPAPFAARFLGACGASKLDTPMLDALFWLVFAGVSGVGGVLSGVKTACSEKGNANTRPNGSEQHGATHALRAGLVSQTSPRPCTLLLS